MQLKRIRSINARVISLRIFLGIPDKSGRWVNFERIITPCYSRRKPRNSQTESGDSWHNAREFIPMPEDPIKRRFASMEKKNDRDVPEMTDSPSIRFDNSVPLKLCTILHRDYGCNKMIKAPRVYGECMSSISRELNDNPKITPLSLFQLNPIYTLSTLYQ